MNTFINYLINSILCVWFHSLSFLDRRISMANMPSTHSEDWQPLISYRNSLLHGESDQPGPVAVNKKVYVRKGKKTQAGDDDGDDVM